MHASPSRAIDKVTLNKAILTKNGHVRAAASYDRAWNPPSSLTRAFCLWLGLFILLPAIGAGKLLAAERAESQKRHFLDWYDQHTSRPSWTNTRLRGFPDPPPPLKLVRAYPDLSISNLIALNHVPGSEFLLAVDHENDWGGPSRIVQFFDSDATVETRLFLERPEIIYGLAFHPEFQTNRRVFIGCNGHSEELGGKATRVVSFRVVGDGPFHCMPESAEVVIEWKSDGHNGGDLCFGNDGLLYVSAGDGTSDSDTNRTGQNLKTLTGSVLRINVDEPEQDRAYSIPDDNPFVQLPEARPEIWAYGLRNPWRLSFDAESNQLWAGNNGQDLWESVYLIEKGANYGWSIKESNHPFHPEQDHGPVEISPATFEHDHGAARSLTGGHVYRGTKFPSLQGAYIYGDFSTGNIWAIRVESGQVSYQSLIANSNLQITGFGVDTDGELLVADHAGGIYRFEENDTIHQGDFPRLLSQTGLFDSTTENRPLPGLIPYTVNAPLWSDGATKHRWMAIPDSETIGYKKTGSWDFPEATILVKTFSFPDAAARGQVSDEQFSDDRRRVETRLLTKQAGQWYGYSYRWNKEQTDAQLVETAGRDETLEWVESPDGQPVRWRYPSRSQCMVCHSRAANFVLGVSSEQLHQQPSPKSQVSRLANMGLFGEQEVQLPAVPLVDPHDAQQDIEKRARSYLHANCAGCHVVSGGGNSKINLRFSANSNRTNLLKAPPLHGNSGLESASLIEPGRPDRSVLLRRLSIRGNGQMPPLATNVTDRHAIQLIAEWIQSLAD